MPLFLKEISILIYTFFDLKSLFQECNKQELGVYEKVYSNRLHSRQEENMQRTCTEQKLDEIGARLETYPKKSLA
jgi:hypothetical protein